MRQHASADAPHALRGIAFMAVTLMCYSLIDAATKYLSVAYPVVFLLWARYVFQTLFMIVLLVRAGSFGFLRTKRLGLQSLRAGLNIATNFAFIVGLSFLPLANAVALLMVGPLFVTALSVPLLGEKVGMRRWAAVGTGFVGALIIVRPGVGDSFQWASLLLILAALINALFQITTRKLTTTEQPLTTHAYLTLTGLAVTSALVPFFWIGVSTDALILLAAQGVMGNASNLCLIAALHRAPASTLAPFNYITLAFAAALGYLIFDQFPDHWTITGALVIVASGLYIIHREAVQRRKQLEAH